MSRLDFVKRLVEIATQAVQMKQQHRRPELKRAVSRWVHIKQTRETEDELTKALIPVFVDQIKSMAGRLRELEGKSFDKAATDAAANLFDQIFDPQEWHEELVNKALPILARKMIESAKVQMLSMRAEVDKSKSIKHPLESPRIGSNGLSGDNSIDMGKKETTATEWLNDHPNDAERLEEMLADSGVPITVLTETPQWMKEEIGKQLTESFSHDYWKDIHKATKGDAERYLRQGLEEGWSIRRMADTMAGSFAGDTGRYAKMRATRIARTESGHALNGSRKASMNQLQQELGPEVSMRPTWLSVLGSTTRDTHADLDGVPADENGMWNLSGYSIPWPGHSSLPPGERIACQCSLVESFGMQEDEASRLIQEYDERVESGKEESE